jgi:hypothetical protein
MKTAVEWLIQELKENSLLTFDEWKELFEKAKEMEKEKKHEREIAINAFLKIQEWQMNYVQLARTTEVYKIAQKALIDLGYKGNEGSDGTNYGEKYYNENFKSE